MEDTHQEQEISEDPFSWDKTMVPGLPPAPQQNKTAE